jgi:hypothetical protein
VCDLVHFERRGIPAVGVATAPFADEAVAQARLLGMPDCRMVYVPHPVQLLTDDELTRRADAVFPSVLAALTSVAEAPRGSGTGPSLRALQPAPRRGARPYWGDEADTVSGVSRSLPQLIRLPGHIGAVYGLYYLPLWPVVKVLGPGEFATRLPSAGAMAAASLGAAAIGSELRSRRAGLYARAERGPLPVARLPPGTDLAPIAIELYQRPVTKMAQV